MNHETVEISTLQKRILVAQLGDARAREAIDALRSATDDLDVPELAQSVSRPAPGAVQSLPADVSSDIQAILDKLNREKSTRQVDPVEVERSRQRSRKVDALLRSVSEGEQSRKALADSLDLDDEPAIDDEAFDENAPDRDSEQADSMRPEPIYARNTNYDQIPWTMGDVFSEEEESYDQQLREEQMCRQMWACAGGRHMSPSDRFRRNLRRNHELLYADNPCGMPFPLLSGFIAEPLMGYGFFGAPLGDAAAAGCSNCNGTSGHLQPSWFGGGGFGVGNIVGERGLQHGCIGGGCTTCGDSGCTTSCGCRG